MGAKDSFEMLETNEIYAILNRLTENKSAQTGKGLSAIYKMALDAFSKQGESCMVPQNLKLYAESSTERGFYSVNEIFYADNNILPDHIASNIKMLKLPKRSGERNVHKYFGVKSTKELPVIVEEGSVCISACNDEFTTYFEQIKPYLLGYRLYSPNLRRPIKGTEVKKAESAAIKSCKIQLVNSCSYTFEGATYELGRYEYIIHNNIFYLHVGNVNNINDIRNISNICDSFADIICIVFKINDLRNDFRFVFKNEINDTKHLISDNLGEEALADITKLMGVSEMELHFWRNIFTFCKYDFPTFIENDKKLKDIVIDKLGIQLNSNDYRSVDFEKFDNEYSGKLAETDPLKTD